MFLGGCDMLDMYVKIIGKIFQGCHRLRGRRAGSSLYLDVHIEVSVHFRAKPVVSPEYWISKILVQSMLQVNPFLSVSAAHGLGEAVRYQIHKSHPQVTEVFIHIGILSFIWFYIDGYIYMYMCITLIIYFIDYYIYRSFNNRILFEFSGRAARTWTRRLDLQKTYNLNEPQRERRYCVEIYLCKICQGIAVSRCAFGDSE